MDASTHGERAQAYRVYIEPGVEDAYVATVPDFPGISGCGDSPHEAVAEAYAGLADALETFELDGRAVPEPLAAFNGQLTVRVPRTLQRLLVDRAEREGVSVNAAVTMLLTQALQAEALVPPVRRKKAAQRR
jgi:predicted RNase H-like HicB family nuclease